MKKYIIGTIFIILISILGFISYYILGFYIKNDKMIVSFTSSNNTSIYVNGEIFTIKGVNMGSGIPGHFATEYAIDKKTYKRWFKQIQEMGANTIRVYTILSPEFYNAFYEYNENNNKPLYLIHGVWIDDYIQNSKSDATTTEFKDKFISDCETLIDVIHGRKYILNNDYYSNGFYNKDISKWTIGYILGVEWEDVTVAYTDNKNSNDSYTGKYISTKESASSFMTMLAEVGDRTIEYESSKYGEQRLLAFSNWPTTDPFDYNEKITKHFRKCAKVDVEQLIFSKEFVGGTFASYHVYPYYPDYLNYDENKVNYVDSKGNINTYYTYLKRLTDYHTIPVVISEFGVSTGRGMAQKDINTGFNQGNMSEKEQGEALVSMYNSILEAGCAGGAVFTWQDEWFKRTWNTMQNVNLNYTPYWSDVQTNEQYFGLLSFDPGKEKSISYVDGDISEWTEKDIISQNENTSLSMKYDEKYIYLLANIKNLDITKKVYIPIDTTQKSGSKTTSMNNQKYSRNIDFLIEISGKENSRVYVQEYYDALMAMHSEDISSTSAYFNKPSSNSTTFVPINLILQTTNALMQNNEEVFYEVYETGKLQYGNGNPESSDYNSLADYIINGDYIEIRIPWQLLNFSNPSKMMIHDDYYEHYGVEEQQINKMYIGIGTEDIQDVNLNKVNLKGWGTDVDYHERLKQSYYILQEYWTSGDVK